MEGLDIRRSHNAVVDEFHHFRFEDITLELLRKFDLVVHLAGASSVSEANKDKVKATMTNAIETFYLVKKCNQVGVYVAYASSGSIFSATDGANFSLKGIPVNAYDGSKMAADVMVSSSGLGGLAMCFGTVSGYAFGMREELIFNAMNLSAFKHKKVSSWNGSNLRSILFLNDLAKYFDVIVDQIERLKQFHRVQLYSWSGSIDDLGFQISNFWDVDFESVNGAGSYSFVLSDQDFFRTFGVQIKKSQVAEECDHMRVMLYDSK